MDEMDVRTIGYCAECDSEITDDIEDVYVDDEGHTFCSSECAMIYYGLHKLEFQRRIVCRLLMQDMNL